MGRVREVVVENSCGRVRGALQDGVYTFRGIPYGAHTGGANRFQAPQPIAWTGVRDALDCGPRSPQNEKPTNLPYLAWLRDRREASENCLVLNVFTSSLGTAARRPVMVYVHGGGFASSSTGTAGVDGSNLSRRDVVVVSVNHRLNLFGHLYLGGADAGKYADSGNAGILDLVAALEWVNINISVFGGNPNNVTIFGQSGGGSKVATLMAMPRARGLFHKAIIQSASSLLRLATIEEAERNTHHFLAQLGLDQTKLRTLHEVPVDTLLKAMPAAVKAAGLIDNYRPVVDGRTLPSQPFEAAAVALSADVPMIIGWCENEQRLAFAPTPAIYQISEREARARTAQVLGVPEQEAAKLIDVYRSGRPEDTPGDTYTQIFGDHRYRRNVTHAAELQVAHGGAPVYLYLLKWKTPVLNGLLRTPHTLCIAFTFANVDVATGITGTGTERYPLQDEMAGAWVSFAKAGNPNHPQLPTWHPYSVTERATMIFDRENIDRERSPARGADRIRALSTLLPSRRRRRSAIAGLGFRAVRPRASNTMSKHADWWCRAPAFLMRR